MARYQVTAGTVTTPLRVVVYGPEGIGKSTLAAEFPEPLFVDVEGGTNQLPVARLPRPTSWGVLLDEVRAAADGEVPCSTLVIDTADAAEALCTKEVCAAHGWKGVEDAGYGKGWTYEAEEFRRLLDGLSAVVDGGRNVVVLSHSQMRKFERPDEEGAYDRFELKLSKKVAPMVKEWADMVLFCDYKTYVTTDKSGRARASGGRRVIRTTHNPCWDAKNRFGLPDEMEMSLGELPPQLAGVVPDMRASHGDGPEEPEPDQAPDQAPEPARERPDYPERLSALADLMERDGVTDDELRRVVGASGNFPASCPVTGYEQGFVDFLVAQWPTMVERVRELREADGIPVPFGTEDD